MDEITKEAFKLYHPPFKFVHGYVYDAKDEMVADQDLLSEGLENATKKDQITWPGFLTVTHRNKPSISAPYTNLATL